MGSEKLWIMNNHEKTDRDYIARVNDDKIKCRTIAKQFGEDFFDGERRYGYGGYKYISGWWKTIAANLIQEYNLIGKKKVIDIGCAKGFLLAELLLLNPELEVFGIDISDYAIDHCDKSVKNQVEVGDARKLEVYRNKEFDLVLSINTLHNLKLKDLSNALKELERIGKESYIVVESHNNEKQKFNVECWNLTAETVLAKDDWLWLFNQCHYRGDYDFLYFN
jgi:SAM-dependent methyltransferase